MKHRLVEAALVLVLSEKEREKIQTEYAWCGLWLHQGGGHEVDPPLIKPTKPHPTTQSSRFLN